MSSDRRPIVGFTGSRSTVTPEQMARVKRELQRLRPRAFHHGDCIGADEAAHHIALVLGIRIIVHPPINPKARAYCEGAARYKEPRPYMARNQAIVDACDLLIATPSGGLGRSGTWATINRARHARKPTIIINRDGERVDDE